MGKLKCRKCGKNLEYTGTKDVDTNVKEGKIWITEIWECLECQEVEYVEITGDITGITY